MATRPGPPPSGYPPPRGRPGTPPPREKSLQNSCLRILKERGLTGRKRHGDAYGVAGDPDLYFLCGRFHVEVELKRPGEEPTPLQRLRLAEWAKAGAITRVIHSTTEFRCFLDELPALIGAL